ncbi:thrombospondin related sporozoite protein, putative [Plasmodium malariae]|uniref:Thrombospondin related sporozoite protein, putative n=1 Tax=Plasmodium malariae TaxID=5858 RepID=A0A1A8WZX0_PLAMA|nr:thrombospondin related sporozoite protein, putative [Plasmodium malariae]SBS98539.1 thrombospondin related sporozoite protein, putative [Plasmodium malariae]SBT87150.1 thrombospondin related sporozoite protein, putative [Plasmodium malariae]
MMINISRYFFLLYIIKSHLNFYLGLSNHFSEQNVEAHKLLHSNQSVLKNRILKEVNRDHCNSWSEWSACSKTCDVGVKMRVRTSSKKENSADCSKLTETSICFLEACPYSATQKERDINEMRQNEKKRALIKYLIIFSIFSGVSILLLLICTVVSIKKKII